MIVPASKILPSQDYLKEDTLKFILDLIANDRLGELPPSPIVVRGDNDELIAIDGHNLIAVMCFLKENVEVHLATSKDDGLPEENQASALRNKETQAKFEGAISNNKIINSQGIFSFQDLIKKYQPIFDNYEHLNNQLFAKLVK